MFACKHNNNNSKNSQYRPVNFVLRQIPYLLFKNPSGHLGCLRILLKAYLSGSNSIRSTKAIALRSRSCFPSNSSNIRGPLTKDCCRLFHDIPDRSSCTQLPRSQQMKLISFWCHAKTRNRAGSEHVVQYKALMHFRTSTLILT